MKSYFHECSNKSIRIGCKGSSDIPLYFISRYKGDSVGRYRRYPLETRRFKGPPLRFLLGPSTIFVLELSQLLPQEQK